MRLRFLRIARSKCSKPLRAGRALPEIADELGISANTLQGHLTNIRQRLGVNKSREIAEAAFNLGIVHLGRRSR